MHTVPAYTTQLSDAQHGAPLSRRAAYIARQAERRRVNDAKAATVVPGVIVEVTRRTDDDSFRLFVTAVRWFGRLVRAYGYDVDERGRALTGQVRGVWMSVGTLYAVRPPTRAERISEMAFGRPGRHRSAEARRGRPSLLERLVLGLFDGDDAADTVTVASDVAGDHAKARAAWEAVTGRPIGSVEQPRTDDQYEVPEPGADLNALDDDEPADGGECRLVVSTLGSQVYCARCGHGGCDR